jgi:hypothetical protein
MKITEDVRKYAAEQKISDNEALQTGMEHKAREFNDAGAENLLEGLSVQHTCFVLQDRHKSRFQSHNTKWLTLAPSAK